MNKPRLILKSRRPSSGTWFLIRHRISCRWIGAAEMCLGNGTLENKQVAIVGRGSAQFSHL